jgi:hypothetical protein
MDPKRDKTRWCFYLFTIAVSVFLPVLVWRFSLLIAPDSHGQLRYLLEIFATCASAGIALAVAAAWTCSLSFTTGWPAFFFFSGLHNKHLRILRDLRVSVVLT